MKIHCDNYAVCCYCIRATFTEMPIFCSTSSPKMSQLIVNSEICNETRAKCYFIDLKGNLQNVKVALMHENRQVGILYTCT